MKMGVLICFDIEFCEPARVLGLLGAQVSSLNRVAFLWDA
jgi:predicted amidohydrolase